MSAARFVVVVVYQTCVLSWGEWLFHRPQPLNDGLHESVLMLRSENTSFSSLCISTLCRGAWNIALAQWVELCWCKFCICFRQRTDVFVSEGIHI